MSSQRMVMSKHNNAASLVNLTLREYSTPDQERQAPAKLRNHRYELADFGSKSKVLCESFKIDFGKTHVPVKLTVDLAPGQQLDAYLRAVQSILNCKAPGCVRTILIISPYEAQSLLPWIRKSNFTSLHVYTPRINAAASTIEDLQFCSVPAQPSFTPKPSISRQINLYAGQLYIRDYEEYKTLCEFLGLCYESPKNNLRVNPDGFILPQNRGFLPGGVRAVCVFNKSPVEFLRVLFNLRRKGQGIRGSHIGKILNGELLSADDFKQ